MGSYNLLLGIALDSPNRGVNALGIGAITLLVRSFREIPIRVAQLSSSKKVHYAEVMIDGSPMEVTIHAYSKYALIRALMALTLKRILGHQPRSPLARLILDAERVFAANEGDSFSDIYGFRRLFSQVLCVAAVLLAGRNLTFLPQTIGPFSTRAGRIIGKYIIKRVDRIYVRGIKSADLLDEWQCSYKKAADVSIYIDPKETAYALSPHTVGINVNGLLYYRLYGPAEKGFEHYGELLKNLIKKFIKLEHNVLLIPHTYSTIGWIGEDDLRAIKEIAAALGSGSVSCLNQEWDAQELKGIIGQTDFFVGSRMHACLAGLSRSVPTVGLAYSYKFEGTFDMFGQKDCALNIRGLSPGKIDDTIAAIINIFDRRKIIHEELIRYNSHRENLILD
ncbi:MAG: polysaccharide pyruvyl transferase family protein [candidate division Zixibacteria bacterium]|nr:polysaccharide pyruvyl transferase family protein [candidate division Zixibacteria bacterium]